MMRLLLSLLLLLGLVVPAQAQIVRGTQFVFGQAALTSSRRVLTGAGSPEAVVTAPIGTVYLQTNSAATVTAVWSKQSGTGNTGWGQVAATTDTLAQFAATTSAQLAGVLSNETGTGLAVFNNTPTLIAPLLGTPTSGVLTNLTGLPLTTGVTGTLPVANGGTGATTFTDAGVLIGNVAGAVQVTGAGTSGQVLTSNGAGVDPTFQAAAGGGAPADATYITQTANATLSAEQALGLSASGIMRNATTTGVVTILTDSAGIAANVSDETGTGVMVFGTAPTFSTSLALTGLFTVGTTGIATHTSSAAEQLVINSTAANGGYTVIQRSGLAIGYMGSSVVMSGFGTNNDTAIRSENDLYLVGDTGVFVHTLDGGAAGDEDVCKNPTTSELTDANASTCIVSSLRFKDVIAPLDTGLAEVLQLHPFSYSLKNDPLKVPQIGLSAEEMFEVEPRLVFFEQEGQDKGKPRGIMYEQSVALLTKAIQELTACVKDDNPKLCLAGIEAGTGERQRSWIRRLLPW